MNIAVAKPNHAREIAIIHKTEIKEGFLSSLPVNFLATLYEAIITSAVGFCVVALEEQKVIGFISGTASVKDFYRYFLRHYFLKSAFILFLKIFNITSLKKIIENLLYPTKKSDAPDAELLTMAVLQKYQGQGIASQLFVQFTDQMHARHIHSFKVIVGESLQKAKKFYERNGFSQKGTILLHGSAISHIYIYDIKH